MPELYISHGEQLLAGTVAGDPTMVRVISSHPFLGSCRGDRMAQRWKWWSQEAEIFSPKEFKMVYIRRTIGFKGKTPAD